MKATLTITVDYGDQDPGTINARMADARHCLDWAATHLADQGLLSSNDAFGGLEVETWDHKIEVQP